MVPRIVHGAVVLGGEPNTIAQAFQQTARIRTIERCVRTGAGAAAVDPKAVGAAEDEGAYEGKHIADGSHGV